MYGSYWSGTQYSVSPTYLWQFYMDTGFQGCTNAYNSNYAIALRNGQVSVVPIPGAILLLGSGLLGMAAAGRKKR